MPASRLEYRTIVREREARARSDQFRRYTWLDVVEEPIPTVVGLKQLLGA